MSEAPTAARLAVTSLTLTALRCFPGLTLSPGQDPVALIGPNGAGKTTVLEALSLLTPGRGLRNAAAGDLARVESAGTWGISAAIGCGPWSHRIGTGADPQAPEGRRLIRIDGKPATRQSDLSALVGMVWLIPQQYGLFLDGAAARRRWLDRLVFGFDPAHAGRVSRYDRLLRERTALLRTPGFDRQWLAVLEDELVTTGAAILAARRDLTRRLNGALAGQPGPFPAARLTLVGAAEALFDHGPALAAEGRWRDQLVADRTRDADSGGARLGPQRSDLETLFLPGAVPAERCSTGEQKALLVALTLATARLLTAETGRRPLVLLDDVAALLDGDRRRALFALLDGMGVQYWLTGTESAQVDGASATPILIGEGVDSSGLP